jgi:hypothetical protein
MADLQRPVIRIVTALMITAEGISALCEDVRQGNFAWFKQNSWENIAVALAGIFMTSMGLVMLFMAFAN